MNLNLNLDGIAPRGYGYVYCESCGRRIQRKGLVRCDLCRSKIIPSSIFEWNLTDALRREIKRKMMLGAWVKEQLPIPTVNNSLYHYDIYIWVNGKSSTGGCGYLIEVNGPEHYSMDGMDRDSRKLFTTVTGYLRPGIGFLAVKNEACGRDVVDKTAEIIVEDLIDRANCV